MRSWMGAMVAFDAAFGLRRRGPDDVDSQLGAHASELRLGLDPRDRLLGRRLALVDVLPIDVERLRDAVRAHPALAPSTAVGRASGASALLETRVDAAESSRSNV